MIRIANARNNTISQATARLWLFRLENMNEGHQLRRYYELKLDRREHPMFSLSWTLFHVIDETSALYGLTPDDIAATEAALALNVSGVDDNSAQQLYARKIYAAPRYPLEAPLPRYHQPFGRGQAGARLQPVSRSRAGAGSGHKSGYS